ncbi:MAG: hypothetical protein HN823_06650, partial [Gammaproteobacteria bacterium]|nr:hypothetical protein [Gammaproteobacteria bacterium]
MLEQTVKLNRRYQHISASTTINLGPDTMLIIKRNYFTRAVASFALAAISLLSAPALASGKPDTQALSDTVRVLASDAFGG